PKVRKLIAAVLAAVFFAVAVRAEEEEKKPPEQEQQQQPPEAPKPLRRRHAGMAVKPVVCRVVEEGKGKAGQELADAIEHLVTQFHRTNYRLSAIMPGDPPIACFYSQSDPSKLPMGAR